MCPGIRKLLCILAIVPFIANGQTFSFSPTVDDPAAFQILNSRFQKIFEAETASLQRENRKELKEFLQFRHNNVKAKIEDRELYLAPDATAYLDKITSEILRNNPQVRASNPAFFFSRSGIPNASSLGEGMIVINMGLVTKLQNEGQLAFILCHEIAHHFLRHGENSIREYLAAAYSKETQQALKDIKQNQYNRRAQADEVNKRLSFDTRKHSRDHESEADSLAVEFLKNTRFQLKESLTALSLLDQIDSVQFNSSEWLQKNFSSNDYPFKKRWLKAESGLSQMTSFTDHTLPNPDSLKTHPDCKTRITLLTPLLEKYTKPGQPIFPENLKEFTTLQMCFEYEIVEYAYNSANYSRSLFYLLPQLNKHPQDSYLIVQTGKIFKTMYEARLAHTLGKSVDLPSHEFQEDYNTVLRFINNLYPEDYPAIAYQFMKKQESHQQTNPAFSKLFTELSKLSN